VLQIPQAMQLGLPWQGRYMLPVAVGIPILAGFVCLSRLEMVPQFFAVRVAWVVAVGMSVLQLVAFVTNLRRYVAGDAAPYFQPVADPWQPPLAPWLLVVLYVVALSGYLVLARVLPRGGEDAAGETRVVVGASVGVVA